jgi:hypothetical protein
MRESPISASENNKLTVKFEYQQSTQAEKNRLDHIKNMKYSELVGRSSLPQSSSQSIMMNRHNMDHEDEKHTSSTRDIDNKMSQSMHIKLSENNMGSLPLKSSHSHS